MEILITGGTGFIGKSLCLRLISKGYQLTILTRRPSFCSQLFKGNVRCVRSLDDIRASDTFEYVINLAGEPIVDHRWSSDRINQLKESRIGLTKSLLACLDRLERKPKKLISGSAVGFYGDKGSTLVDEMTEPHPEFTNELCNNWEQMALRAEDFGVSVCLLRTGLVVGPNGGFLKKLLLPFKLGLGGRLGSGDQWMSWVYLDDIVSIILYLMLHPTLTGVFNATAPNPVTNIQFTKALGLALKRPTPFPAPAFVLKMVFGEMSRLLLTGQRVLPQRLYEAGYKFRYTELEDALHAAINEKH